MARGPLIAFVAVLLAGALAAGGYLVKKREAIASTPSAYTGAGVWLPLNAGSEACADETVFDQHSQVARFGAAPAPGTSVTPAIEVTARGYDTGEFRNDYRSSHRVEGGWRGLRTLNVPLTPPSTPVFGFLCVRNVGDHPINLLGSSDGRAYSRPTVRVDGKETATELQFRLLQHGRHSLISRTGEITTHAATLKPFGAWWFWLLAVALLTVAPLAAFGALRTALAGDEARGLTADPARATPNLDRARQAFARVPGWAIVAAGCAIALLWFAYWSLSTRNFQNDEDQYVYLSRWLQTDFPSTLWNFAVYGRGLQRLEVWLLAVPSALFDSPWSLRGGRILNTLAWVSTAVPVYLLGLRLQLRPRWAALPAVLSIVVPWSVVTTSFLTENVAYPACMWALWAIWLASVKPGVRADVVALALVLVAGMARTGLLLLAPVLPLVVAGTGLRCATGSLAARVRAVLREHVVLWAAVALGVLFLVLGFSDRLAGGYLHQLGFDLGSMLDRQAGYVSKVVVGTGFLPAAVAIPWVVIQLARSRDRGTFAFALLVAVASLGLLYSLNTAGPDERYVLYLGPLLLLPATLALARREVSPLGLGITSVLLAALLVHVPWSGDHGPWGYFISPVEMFWIGPVGARLDRHLPGGAGVAYDLAAVALGAIGLTLALILARRRALLTTGLVAAIVAAVAVVIPLQTQYAVKRFVNGAGAKSGPSDRQWAFADTRVPKGRPIGQFLEGAGKATWYWPIWQQVQFYNQRIDRAYSIGANTTPIPIGDPYTEGITFNPTTGRLSVPLTDYVVYPLTVGNLRLRGQTLYTSTFVPVGLMRVAQPATLAWSAKGFDDQAQIPDGKPADVRFYGTGLPPGPRCATYTLLAPPDRRTQWRIEGTGTDAQSGTVAAGQVGRVKVPLPDLVARGFLDVRLSGEAIHVVDISVAPKC
jgi:hypothetical protein